MKLQKIINTLAFKGIREDRNTTEQLKRENNYSLTDNNQKKISKAIESLGENSGERNVKFLLDVAENLKYGTNIDNGAKPRNDWKLKLKNAAEKSLSMSDPITREKLSPEMSRIFYTQKPLSEDELQLLQSKENILKNINKSELDGEKNKNIKNIEGNLNHFLVSSEVPIHQKKYILNRFEYLLSPEYNINPQLANKKTVVLAEMLNDIVVTTNETNTPNTKAINQKQHGMCAAISIARKLMSYEYKPDFVDSILSELDDSEQIMVYDTANLGSNKKIPVQKTYVDFEDAMRKGYRIIDASTTQWMNIADMSGVDNKSDIVYTPFDSIHFGTFTDSHYNSPLSDLELQAKQSYYQALIKAKENFDAVKLHKIENREKNINNKQSFESDIETLSSLNNEISKALKSNIPNIDNQTLQQTVKQLLSLEKDYSMNINKTDENLKKYSFIHNEEEISKNRKIKTFIKDKLNATLSDETINDIKDLIIMSNSISNTSLQPKSSLPSKIAYDRKLFNAASAFRTSMILSLTDKDLKTDVMIHYDVLDHETFASNALSRYIKKVEEGDTRYIKSLSTMLGTKADKKEILPLLNDLKNGYDYNTTQALDDLYGMLGAGNRKQALFNRIKFVKDTIQHGDKDSLRIMSVAMKMPKDKNKITKKLEEYEQVLSNNPTENDYRYILNKVGTKDQFEEFADAYKTMADAIKQPENEFNKKIINNMKIANGLPEDTPIKDLEPLMIDIANLYNTLLNNLHQLKNTINIQDEKGIYIDSLNPNLEITKKMENTGVIIPASELLRLQIRYDAIDKIRSQDEFSSRQGKISDPTLYKYTKAEKETLKKIEKSINDRSSTVNRELVGILRELKKPLEEQARKIGSNMGMYWSMPEGGSGLYSFQQAKILQQLTGKPYQIIEDFDKAIDIIKNSPHSGISGTHVFHTKHGAHAQYISEISEHNGKDILFHDNSWGASEHENTWVDSEGLLRTDYSDNRGGELGYITDDRFRNGNYVQNLTEKTGEFAGEKIHSKELKKLKGDREPYKFALMNDIILPGISEEANDTAAAIKDNVFLPDSRFLGEFETKLSNMTLDEIRSKRIRLETVGEGYRQELKEIKKRLEVTPFNKGIQSKADYDALADNDPLKVAFEKAALDMSYNYISRWKEMAKIDNVKDLKKLKEKEKQIARENFEYAFGKSKEILYAYALNRTKNNIYNILSDTLTKYNFKLDNDMLVKVINNIAVFEKEEKNQFDGNLSHTIDFMINKMTTRLEQSLPQTDDAKKAVAEIKEKTRNDLAKGLYFSKRDLLKQTDLNTAIIKYIDKKYQPESDEEFVKIYNRLQNMTTEEFQKETADAKDEDMAFKNISGYDILKKYKASHSPTMDKITNIVWQKYLINDIKISDTTPHIQYKKLQKKVRGAYYTHGKTYDDLYRSFKYTLTGLNYEKMFNKYKDINYKKYGVMPAYPKIDVIDNKMIEDEIEIIDTKIAEYAGIIRSKKLNLQAYETTDKITALLSKIPDDKKLTKTQAQILNTLVGEFITDFYNDLGFKKSIEAAENMLELSYKNDTAKAYKELFKVWEEQTDALRKLHPPETLKETMKDDLNKLKDEISLVVRTGVPQKHYSKIMEDVDKLAKEIFKEATNTYDTHDTARILKQKLLSKVNTSTQENTVENFLNNLDLEITQIKKLRTTLTDKTKLLEKQNQDVIQSMLVFMEDSVPEEYVEKFPDIVMNIYRREDSFDANDLRKEISKIIGVSEEELANNKIWLKFSSNVIKYNKTFRIRNNYQKTLKEKTHNLQETMNKFIEKHIEPEHDRSVAKILENYSKREILLKNKPSTFNVDRWVEFKDNLNQNYQKYHYWKNPVDLLDRYTELCAKDGELAKAAESKDARRTELLEHERNFARNSLKAALDYAELVEMQEILMDSASNLGNPALVVKKFKNYDSEYWDDKTGVRMKLNDPKIINYMVRKLLHNKSNSTSIMFVEKLGLTDQFIERENEMFDVPKVKKKVDSLIKILKTANAQTSILDEELDKFTNDDVSVEEFSDMIDEAKQNIIQKTKKLNRKKTVRKILAKLDDTKVLVAANPKLPKTVVLEQSMREVKQQISEDINEDVAKVQDELNEINTIYKLINEINVPQYRDAYKFKEEFNKKFNEIENYRNETLLQVMSESSAIDIRTNPA